MKTKILALLCAVLMCSSCKDYLDIVPDNVATLDHAFTNMETAEKFLFTCYSYMPNPADVHNTPAFVSGFIYPNIPFLRMPIQSDVPAE